MAKMTIKVKEATEPKTRVWFGIEQDEDGEFQETLAVFVDDIHNGRVSVYSPVGQHSEADIDYVRGLYACTHPKSDALYNELKGLGYDLEVINTNAAEQVLGTMFPDGNQREDEDPSEFDVYESKKCEDFKNFTLKQLRFQLKNGWAKDLTNASDEEIQAIIDSGHEISGVSNGTYGMNGLLVNYTNPDGSIGSGVVIGRTPNLFALLSPQKLNKAGDAPKPSESTKNEATYDRPVSLYITTRYDDAEEAQNFIKDMVGEELTVSKDRNGDVLYVSIEGSDDAIDAFLEVYKDEYENILNDCDVDANGWVSPDDTYYSSIEGRKELMGESTKK